LIQALACAPISYMGFDFSALDAELAALGTEPADVLQLAAQFAGSLTSLADADQALSELEQGVAVFRAAPRLELTRLPEPEPDHAPLELAEEELTPDDAREPAPSIPPPNEPRLIEVSGHRPESGEMALPEPVKRPPEDPISGELALVDSEPPTSGSFALPANDAEEDLSPVFTSDLPSSPLQPRSERPLHQSGAPGPSGSTPMANVRTYSEGPELHVGELSDEDDDPDTAAVFAAFDEAPNGAPSGETRLKGLSDLPSAPEGRDPDAEFDAIFSDATSPSGLPTRGFGLGDEEAPSAEELLTGLETVMSHGEPEPEDQTEVMTLGTIGAAIPIVKDDNPFDDELGSSEFEIVLDEGTPEEPAEAAPSKPPKRSPPPPLPPSGSTSLDKRPSFLGRLFGRKDGPPAGDQ
jgi:hypothetical protein